MVNRWKGNIIAAAATTSSGTDYTGKANGAWGLNSQLQQKQGGLWAKAIYPPSAPTIGTAVKGNSQATISFTASTDTGGGTITSYTATSTPSGITGSSATSPITVTGLTNGTSYTFTVHANATSGTSAESAFSNAVTPSAATVPSAPTIGTATAVTSTSASVNFTAPNNDGGASIISYTATSTPGNITGTVTQSGSGSVTVTGLTPNTSYTFKVFATNSEGNSANSASSNSVTPTLTIGEAYGGGFYAGQIIQPGGVKYNLVVAPKASGESTKPWGTYGVATSATSMVNGAANTATLVALGSAYEAAIYCDNLVIGGYNDWYMPAVNELEVLFYYLKPTTSANATDSGANPNAVSPEPINTNYTSSLPAQTSAISFRAGNSECFDNDWYDTSTDNVPSVSWGIWFNTSPGGLGAGKLQGANYKYAATKVRAIRKVIV